MVRIYYMYMTCLTETLKVTQELSATHFNSVWHVLNPNTANHTYEV